jgi:hypothetical protein
MGQLEDELRATFAAAVRSTPAVEDAAGRSITRARDVRRRRAAGAAIIVAIALVIGGAGAVARRDGSGRTGVTTTPTRPLSSMTFLNGLNAAAVPPVDVLSANQIVMSDGQTVSLVALPPARRAYRTGDVWLVETWNAQARRFALWRVTMAGQARQLVEGQRIAVSADGSQVAWSLDDSVQAGRISGDSVTAVEQTPGTDGFGPLAFVAGGVLLGRTQTGVGIDSYDMWFPSRGIYTVGPRRNEPIFGPNGAGTLLYGLDVSAPPCLAEIDPNGLKAVRATCLPGLAADSALYPSPDGRWLLVVASTRIDLYDVTTMWREPTPVRQWPDSTATSVVWLEGQTFGAVGPTGAVSKVAPNGVQLGFGSPPDGSPVWAIPRLD